jgi:molybdate/tungstate transport system permease protein
METRSLFSLVSAALGGLVLLFVVAPLLSMIFSTSSSELLGAVTDEEVRDSIALTLWTSMAGTLVFSLGALPLAYLLAKKKFRFKGLIMALIDLPIVIPHSAAGLALLIVLSPRSPLGRAAGVLGFRLVGTSLGITLAMAFVSLPFLINAARDGFLAVPDRLEKAALNLGASPARVFFSISIPLCWRSILSGLIMMWARGMSEFGAVIVVAYHPIVTPILIYERLGAFGLSSARPVAVIFMTVTLVFFGVFRFLSRRREARKRDSGLGHRNKRAYPGDRDKC